MESVILEKIVFDQQGNKSYKQELIPANETDFQINDADLDTELKLITHRIAYYGDIHAQLQTQLSRKEERVKYVYHKLSLQFRQLKKTTENGIKDEVITHPEYQASLDDLFFTKESAKLAESWWRAMQEKANVLRTISNRQMTELKVSPF